MSYIDGFVAAVPNANRQKLIDFANKFDALFIEYGALRVVECLGEDVPKGKVTDYYRAVDAKDDEVIMFSWVEWPDKETRNEAMKKMEALMETDPNYDMKNNPMPFDGMRMIYGGFEPVVNLSK